MASNDFAFTPAQPGADEAPIETTTARFRQDVLEASIRRVVLVDFWAPWCGPCRQLAPVLERLVKATKGKVRLVKMNIDEEPEIAGQLGVKSIPAVVAFQRGRPSDGFVGALPESQLKGFLERLVGPIEADADAFAAIENMLASGEFDEAEAALAELIAAEPPQPKAWAELLRLYIALERLEDAQGLLAAAPEALRRDPLILAAAAALENAIQASALDEVDALHRRVAENQSDPQARFDLALALNAKGLREEAAAQLLEIIQRDRNWNDDGARKQLVQFFEAWGPLDKTTASARRKLSAVLFA
ncbi:thioredoxin [Methylocystis heyeri]|uniref:Thioredoxin n=1 Tax=Methylocystis heyeri TaxID=391905 RepID=A0A6B8KD86_9HYPH|nr:thioredoxin [Methylocystis heyeri]QGM46196.1 thioredoxin [Methylocystis heyeri]